MNARAIILLHRPGPAWGVFDTVFYTQRYGARGGDLRAHYLDHGQQAGWSPNALFDEAFYRAANPDAARAIADGACGSGFDHYCQGGFAELRQPHWLFDAERYLRRYPELDIGTLRSGEMSGLYDHFLKHGDAERRVGHILFQPGTIGATFGFTAFLAGPERRASLWFDPEWYLRRYPDVAAAVREGRFSGALHHYLTNAQPTAFDPLPDFSEAYYLACHPDVAAAVQSGALRNGFTHFIEQGAREQRSPHPAIDLRHYVSHYADVREALARGEIIEPFTHLLRVGRAEGRHTNPAARANVPEEAQTKALFRGRALTLSTAIARQGLDLSCEGPPALSVILVLHDQFALTLQTLASLRASTRCALEVILVDSGSTDETRFIDAYVGGATILRFDANIGFVRGCNAGLMRASAETVLLLNNDVVVQPGAPDAALARLARPDVGVVGGKIVRSHGLTQEAGCYVRADGSTMGAARDLPATHPEASFARDADYVSGVFLMARTALLRELDGFDDAFAPAYYEDADLCLRVRARGLRIVYEPAAVIEHLEYGSAAADIAAHHRMDAARTTFRSKHAAFLDTRAGMETTEALIDAAGRGLRVLFIEDAVPLRRLGSGFVRSNDILHAMDALGCRVTVLPVGAFKGELASLADLPASVCCLHDRTTAAVDDLLKKRRFDTIWVGRTHNLPPLMPALQVWREGGSDRRVIVDTEAVASVRAAARAAHQGEAFDFEAALADELRYARMADLRVATTDADAALLAPLGPVTVLGHQRRVAPTAKPFEARDGMLFVGAIHEAGSPNQDSLQWFVEDVLPRIERVLGWRTRLTVAGHLAADVSLAWLEPHPRVTLRGAMADLTPLYDQARVFVAPTRFAGGAPYKVHEAASRGLPVVATTLLAGQLGWHGGEILVAPADDAATFAQAVLRAHEDAACWAGLRSAALARIAAEHRPDDYRSRLAAILGIDTDGRPAG